jgi:hypothetical protein
VHEPGDAPRGTVRIEAAVLSEKQQGVNNWREYAKALQERGKLGAWNRLGAQFFIAAVSTTLRRRRDSTRPVETCWRAEWWELGGDLCRIVGANPAAAHSLVAFGCFSSRRQSGMEAVLRRGSGA